MVVMPIGVDTRRFALKSSDRYEPIGGAPRLLLVGRIVPRKGVMLAVESFDRIHQVFPGATLQIVGPASDPKYFAAVSDRVAQLGLGDSVHMSGQVVPNEELPHIYQEADLFYFPTTSESLGIVMLESMACGTPVVTLKGSGSTEEVVRHGQDGLVVEPHDLASATISLLKDRDAIKRMGLNAAERIRTDYSDQVTRNTLRSLLDQAVGVYDGSVKR
jgi:glycosyltransferase involved in cell wall biosynthesis